MNDEENIQDKFHDITCKKLLSYGFIRSSNNNFIKKPKAIYQRNLKEKEKEKILEVLNCIFFKDKEQTTFKFQKIYDYYKEILRKEYFKHVNDKKDILFYVLNFIEENILKIIEKNNLSINDLYILKYNIFHFGMYRYG